MAKVSCEQAHLLRDESEALLRADKLVGFPKQGIEGFARPLAGGSIAADSKAGYMNQPLQTASRKVCGLHRGQMVRSKDLEIGLCPMAHRDTRPLTLLGASLETARCPLQKQ